jgi:hypothetical protein
MRKAAESKNRVERKHLNDLCFLGSTLGGICKQRK